MKNFMTTEYKLRGGVQSQNFSQRTSINNITLIFMSIALVILIFVILTLILLYRKRTEELQREYAEQQAKNEMKKAAVQTKEIALQMPTSIVLAPQTVSIYSENQHQSDGSLSGINNNLPESPDMQFVGSGSQSFVIDTDAKDVEGSEEEIYSDPGSVNHGYRNSTVSTLGTPLSDQQRYPIEIINCDNDLVILEQEEAMNLTPQQNDFPVLATPKFEGDGENTGLGLMK